MKRIAKLALLGAITPATALAADEVPTVRELMDGRDWSMLASVDTKGVGKVVIEKRSIHGQSCFRATASSDLSITRLMEVVADVEAEPVYMKEGPTYSKLLASNNNEASYVQYLDMPGWMMMADRFWFARSVTTQTPQRATLTWEGIADPASTFPKAYTEITSKYPKALQPRLNIGGWLFEARDGKTQMEYLLCTDVGGSIPGWVQNSATRSTLPGVVRDVVAEARRRAAANVP